MALDMYKHLLQAFEKEDTLLARDILIKDEALDGITDESVAIAEEYTKAHPGSITQAIPVISIMKMVERMGDHLKNIAEEIIFYAEARVLKHSTPQEYSKALSNKYNSYCLINRRCQTFFYFCNPKTVKS